MELLIKNISKSFRKTPILQDICLTAQSGSCIGILGRNGSGKSTLLSILAGILPMDSGEFLLDGTNAVGDTSRVGYVPQGTPLIEELTARDNLLLWYDKHTLQQELQTGVLSLLGIGEFLHKPVRKLSGGMKKRLSIGCAMAHNPKVLLLDEPTAALDLSCRQEIAAYLRSYRENGGILLLSTHDTDEIALCDKTYILKNGRLVPFVYDGDPARLVTNL